MNRYYKTIFLFLLALSVWAVAVTTPIPNDYLDTKLILVFMFWLVLGINIGYWLGFGSKTQ